MNEEELNRLIEKYYNGESSEEDETILKTFFSNSTCPEGYEAEKEIFGYYMSGHEIPVPSAGFEARIMAGIDALEGKSRLKAVRKYLIPAFSTAAGLLLLEGTYFFFVHNNEPRDTFSDPKIAYDETMKILYDVSSRLNHGTETLKPVSKINEVKEKSFRTINKSTGIIEKNLKSLDYLRNAHELTNDLPETGK